MFHSLIWEQIISLVLTVAEVSAGTFGWMVLVVYCVAEMKSFLWRSVLRHLEALFLCVDFSKALPTPCTTNNCLSQRFLTVNSLSLEYSKTLQTI